jgi:membrane-associated phospholipid phosphatase
MHGRVKPTVGRLLNDARFSLAPRGGEDVLRQGMIMLACYTAYDFSRALVQGREAVAMANGIFFMNLEKALGIYWEPWVQGRVTSVGVLIAFLVWAYGSLHLPAIIATMVWIFTQRRRSWVLWRNWFLAMNFMAVFVFFLLPTAPPRMILTSGVADINYLHGTRGDIFDNGILANPFAAMPSLHFAYALFVALVLFALARHRWLRWGGFLYPLLTFVAIVATGNHFIVDAIAGGLVVLAAYVFAVNVQPQEAPESAAVTVRERDG